MQSFLQLWNEAAITTVGLFWMAFWAFGLGYLISSMIQVFVTRERMKKGMGGSSGRSVFLATFFGFISSSCSFAALSTTRSLFAKGAGLIPALAFMLASTNLVVELGIIIAVFLSWQFVVGEYVGGILLILFMWALVRMTLPAGLEKEALEHAREQTDDNDGDDSQDWRKLIASKEGWFKVAQRYGMEWSMVWKDVTIGFTVAGIIAAFVPRSFFQALFISSDVADPTFWQVLSQAVIGPVAAFFTFIGSMGNIPLAAVLFSNGVSFAGVMAFIFSDLVVFPVLRIQAQYYGWKMAFYLLGILLTVLVAAAVAMHYGFAALDMLPTSDSARVLTDRSFFAVDHTFGLNLVFIILSGVFVIWQKKGDHAHMDHGSKSIGEKVLFTLSMVAYGWLAVGLVLPV